MPLTFEEAGALAFGESEFSSSEFGRRLGIDGGAKVLSELKHRGVVARTGRGRYRFLTPSERPDLRSLEWGRVRRILLDGPDPKAWTGSTAVEVWTRGGYVVAPSAFARVFALAVPERSIQLWEKYLRRHGLSVKPRKRVGAQIELVPVRRWRSTTVGGEPVIPRGEVLTLIRGHPSVFAGAEALLVDRPG
jgi:hypothetical protein